MLCTRSWSDVAIGMVVILFICFGFGWTFFGVVRNLNGIADDQYFSSDHLVLGGSICAIPALLGSLYFLSQSQNTFLIGPIGLVMIMTLFISLYLSVFDKMGVTSQWTVIILLILEVCLEFLCILLGFGVCKVQDMPTAVSQIASTILGGRRRK
uniref:Uncharacterized protein n=1 Tax=viral metagenome TaxID=1070528 RepID=A0A6C0JWN7_9ZZZZ